MRRECDLVMKGGVTSGVIYPPAIYAISRAFDLRSIGGTSAGAIAAALAAAAQYRRVADPVTPEAGYDALARIPAWLGQDGHLFGLFAPNRDTRSLFGTVVALAAPGRSLPQRIGALFAAYRGPALLGGDSRAAARARRRLDRGPGTADGQPHRLGGRLRRRRGGRRRDRAARSTCGGGCPRTSTGW